MRGIKITKQNWGFLKTILLVVYLFVFLIAGFLIIPARADTNYALTFDGTSHYVTLNTATNLFGSTSWTTTKSFSAWILPDPNASPAPATSPAGGEVVLGSDGPRTFGISRAIFNGLDRLWVWHADANGVDLIPVDYTPGTWLHIAAVHANNTLSVYVNGVFLNAVTSGASASTSGTVYLGGSGRSSASTYFHGQIDEVRLWNTALDEATIAAWFNQEITAAHPFFANLTAYYRMSNGSGLVLNDDSGFNHPGSLRGGMSDASWTLSTAFGVSEPPTATPEPPTATSEPPTAEPPTATSEPPTATPEPPTAEPPTATSEPPTARPQQQH
jgi:hypothetical protein